MIVYRRTASRIFTSLSYLRKSVLILGMPSRTHILKVSRDSLRSYWMRNWSSCALISLMLPLWDWRWRYSTNTYSRSLPFWLWRLVRRPRRRPMLGLLHSKGSSVVTTSDYWLVCWMLETVKTSCKGISLLIYSCRRLLKWGRLSATSWAPPRIRQANRWCLW